MTRTPDETGDVIHICELELSVCIGVPDEERAQPQRLTVTIGLWPITGFHEMEDQIEKTVNYAAVCGEIKDFVGGRKDRLLETLGEAIATHLLRTFPLLRVQLELKKFILPDVKHVAISLTRERNAST